MNINWARRKKRVTKQIISEDKVEKNVKQAHSIYYRDDKQIILFDIIKFND